ncbi:MAG: exodeoxyribonuclease VII large subunit [Candidatus Saccharimonadales bacterium]
MVAAIEKFNQLARPPEVLVVIRGGGSGEDLQAFNVEPVVRAIAASRIPTLVAIGHERDISLAELAADARASTPSNAAEFLVPDRIHEAARLKAAENQMRALLDNWFASVEQQIIQTQKSLRTNLNTLIERATDQLTSQAKLLLALSPQAVMARGYVIIRGGGGLIKSASGLQRGSIIDINMADGKARATVQAISLTKNKDR